MIVFDLDDTLVDTSACAGPIKLRAALQAMINAGLKVSSEEKAFHHLQEIDATSPNGAETIKIFLQELNADSAFLEIGKKVYYGRSAEDIPIKLLPGALEVLSFLKKRNTLVLLTTGIKQEQVRKMQKTGLHAFFDKIIVIDTYHKGEHYKSLLREFNSLPSQTLVCGDKFETDLLPAKELKIKTVQMRCGRALRVPLSKERPDYQISKLEELKKIVEELPS